MSIFIFFLFLLFNVGSLSDHRITIGRSISHNTCMHFIGFVYFDFVVLIDLNSFRCFVVIVSDFIFQDVKFFEETMKNLIYCV